MSEEPEPDALQADKDFGIESAEEDGAVSDDLNLTPSRFTVLGEEGERELAKKLDEHKCECVKRLLDYIKKSATNGAEHPFVSLLREKCAGVDKVDWQKVVRSLVESENLRTFFFVCEQHDALVDFDRMFNANMRLVLMASRKVQRDLFDDSVQEGSFGLMIAIAKFNHRLGYRFSTYAACWVKNRVGRGLAEHKRLVHVPSHTVERLKQIEAVGRRILGKESIYDMSAKEIRDMAKHLSCPEDTETVLCGCVEGVIAARDCVNNLVSLDQSRQEGDEEYGGLLNVLPNLSEDSPENLASREILYCKVREAMDAVLTPNEKIALEEHGCNGRTLNDVGIQIGLCRERVRQLYKLALGKLKRVLRHLNE